MNLLTDAEILFGIFKSHVKNATPHHILLIFQRAIFIDVLVMNECLGQKSRTSDNGLSFVLSDNHDCNLQKCKGNKFCPSLFHFLK